MKQIFAQMCYFLIVFFLCLKNVFGIEIYLGLWTIVVVRY